MTLRARFTVHNVFKSDRCGIEISCSGGFISGDYGSNQTVAGLKSSMLGDTISKSAPFKSDRCGIEIADPACAISALLSFKSDRCGIEMVDSQQQKWISSSSFKSDRCGIEILRGAVCQRPRLKFKSDRCGIEIVSTFRLPAF